MRHRRKSVSEPERARHALSVTRRLTGTVLLRRFHRIACYLSFDGEMDLGLIMGRLRACGKRVYVPVLHGRRLRFLPLTAETPVKRNYFGIVEPVVSASTRCDPPALDLVLMPLVAFDDGGNRLGMGGGYYDQTFAYLRNRQVWRKPLLIGVAFECQRLDALSPRPWDIPLHGVVTEKRLYRFAFSA
jgi:5-formyltetrahydrofolate cyclo-ligase